MIRIPQVRVVDEEGAQLGVMPTPRALEMAQERGYDLVEVAPMAQPPVVKFLDFGQYKYELTKREKEAKRKQRSVTFKEVRLTPKIGVGDFDRFRAEVLERIDGQGDTTTDAGSKTGLKPLALRNLDQERAFAEIKSELAAIRKKLG